MKLLAIDPGERVGWATGVVHPDVPKLEVTNQGVNTLKDFAITLGERIHDYDVVIYEVWRLYPHMAKRMVGNDFQPSQLIGVIRYLSWIHPNVKLVSQGASIKNTALKTMPDELKERMSKSSEQHDQDAIQHLWHFYWSKFV